MKKFVLLLCLQILLCWTALYAQVGNLILDSTRCYSLTEMRMLALTSVRLIACDSLLYVQEDKIATKDKLLTVKEKECAQLNEKLYVADQIIGRKNVQISNLEKGLAKEKRLTTFLKKGWLVTFLSLATTTTLLAIIP